MKSSGYKNIVLTAVILLSHLVPDIGFKARCNLFSNKLSMFVRSRKQQIYCFNEVE